MLEPTAESNNGEVRLKVRRADSSDPDRLEVDELEHALPCQLATEATLLGAAKGQAWVAFHEAVDEDAAGVDLRDQTPQAVRSP